MIARRYLDVIRCDGEGCEATYTNLEYGRIRNQASEDGWINKIQKRNAWPGDTHVDFIDLCPKCKERHGN